MIINIKKSIAILFCFISSLSGAHELDSLLKVLPEVKTEKSKIELWEKIINISIWQSSDLERKSYISDLWKYSKSKNNEYGIATANLSYAKHYERLQDVENAIKYADKAYKSFEKQKNKLGLCKVLRQQGYNALKMSSVELATELGYKALDISIEIKNKQQEALCLSQIGVLIFDSQPKEGIKQVSKALDLLMKTDSKREASIVSITLSALYLNLRENTESIRYLDVFFNLQEELNDVGLLAEGYASAAIAYNSIGDIDKAEKLMEASGKYFLFIDSPINQAKYLRMKGVLYRESGKFVEAIDAANKGLSLISDKHGLDIEKGKLQYTLFLSYKAIEKYEEAIAAYEEAVNHEFNLYDEQTRFGIAELKEKYETQKKEEQIKILQEQNKVKDARLEKRTYFIIILSLIVFLLITSGFFIRRQIRLKQQKNSAELENKALRAQMNPHFIFNALNSIQRIYVEGDIRKANDFMADFAQLMRKILENSGSSKITLTEEIETLSLYMDLEKLRCKDCFKYTISIDETISTNLKVAPLLLQPFIENSIWHGILPLENSEGVIDIQIIDFDEENIQVIIRDNGVGFNVNSQNENKNSKGIAITRQRTDNKLVIESIINKGTTVTFKLKKIND